MLLPLFFGPKDLFFTAKLGLAKSSLARHDSFFCKNECCRVCIGHGHGKIGMLTQP